MICPRWGRLQDMPGFNKSSLTSVSFKQQCHDAFFICQLTVPKMCHERKENKKLWGCAATQEPDQRKCQENFGTCWSWVLWINVWLRWQTRYELISCILTSLTKGSGFHLFSTYNHLFAVSEGHLEQQKSSRCHFLYFPCYPFSWTERWRQHRCLETITVQADSGHMPQEFTKQKSLIWMLRTGLSMNCSSMNINLASRGLRLVESLNRTCTSFSANLIEWVWICSDPKLSWIDGWLCNVTAHVHSPFTCLCNGFQKDTHVPIMLMYKESYISLIMLLCSQGISLVAYLQNGP